VITVQEQERRREDSAWISGRVAVTTHAIRRARERLSDKLQNATWARVGRMLEKAVRHPQGEVEPHASIQDGKFQVVVPFVSYAGEAVGYLVVGRDERRAGIVVMTWLEPETVEYNRGVNRRMGLTFDGLPRWWRAFQVRPDEPGFGG
jgi:hypothetical protein